MSRLKENGLEISYYLMWILNFCLIWFTSLVIGYTISRIISLGQARSFIEKVAFISGHSIQGVVIALGAFFGLMIFSFCRDRIKWFHHHAVFSVLMEIGLCLVILRNLSFGTATVLLIEMADCLIYVHRPFHRNLCVGLILCLYLVLNYGFLSMVFPMTSFQEYLLVYSVPIQGLLFGIHTFIFNLNMVVFLIFMFMFIQRQMDETQKVSSINQELNRLNVQLKGYANLREKMGETKERNRLAREIHDTLGHTLTGLSVGLEACKVMIKANPEATEKQLSVLQESAKRGLQDVRRSVDKLKPDALERYSLKEALDIMIMDFEKTTDVTVLYLCHLPLVNLNADEEDIIYRMVQEGMTNALRHGKATKIYVSIAQDDDHLILVIEDNGLGCHTIEPGFGLHHLQERVELLHGKLRYYGVNGFELIAEIPLRRKS